MGVYKIFKDTTCRLYEIKINDLEYNIIKEEIEIFNREKDKYRYNFLGVVALKFGIVLNRENHYFCSQFVARVLDKSKVIDFDKDWAVVIPEDFYNIKNAELVYEGLLTQYEPA